VQQTGVPRHTLPILADAVLALGLVERQGDVWLDHWKPHPGDCILAKIAGHNRGKPQTVCDTSSAPSV
jgi:hypothetical protein